MLSRAFARRRWVRLIELAPPRGHETKDVIEQSLQLRARGIDGVHVPDGVSGPRSSPLSLAVLIRQHVGIEVVLQLSARDKPLIGLQSDLFGAYAMGATCWRPATCVSWRYPTSAMDVDSIGLVNAVSGLNHGLDVGGQSIERQDFTSA